MVISPSSFHEIDGFSCTFTNSPSFLGRCAILGNTSRVSWPDDFPTLLKYVSVGNPSHSFQFLVFLGKIWVTSPDLKVPHPEAPEAPASPASPPPESSSGSASSSSASTSSKGAAKAEAGVGEWIGNSYL